jgi:MoxR-like ATPase
MDQFYIEYRYTTDSTSFQRIPFPIISPDEFPHFQLEAEKVQLSTLVRSYISSILIALRLHPQVVSTSISPRAVEDIRNLIKVSSLFGKEEFVNAEYVPKAVELCTSFRLRMETGVEEVTFEDILKEVLENVRAPF